MELNYCHDGSNLRMNVNDFQHLHRQEQLKAAFWQAKAEQARLEYAQHHARCQVCDAWMAPKVPA